jgi:hypothetical protein
MLEDLCRQLPGVQRLPATDVQELMHKATREALDNPDFMSLQTQQLAVMCQHTPAAKQLSAPFLVDMIYMVIRHHCHLDIGLDDIGELLMVLAALPAAQEISPETAEDILQLCLQQEVPLLFVREPMQQLGVASVRSLLYEAIDWCR